VYVHTYQVFLAKEPDYNRAVFERKPQLYTVE